MSWDELSANHPNVWHLQILPIVLNISLNHTFDTEEVPFYVIYSKLASGWGGFFLKVNKRPEISRSHYRIQGNELTGKMKPKRLRWYFDLQNRKQNGRVCWGDSSFSSDSKAISQHREIYWGWLGWLNIHRHTFKNCRKGIVNTESQWDKSHGWTKEAMLFLLCLLSSLVTTGFHLGAHLTSVYFLVKWDISLLLIINIWLKADLNVHLRIWNLLWFSE